MTGPRLALLLSLCSALLLCGIALVDAQARGLGAAALDGPDLEEERAFEEAEAGHHVKARELAEKLVQKRPESFVGHLVLGYVHHYGEANAPRALYYLQRARALYEARFSPRPNPSQPWRWHARILRELVWTHGELEHYERQLAAMARYSELYDPDLIAERAWPFMKLRRFDDAREAARLGQATGDPRQNEIALNALCAIEFEAGDEEASYRACEAAMQLHGGQPGRQTAVDFTNFAEAARSVFRLDEAERVDLLATEARVSWYGNPWVELAELYLRQGRFVESLHALRQVPRYRARRPPHVQDADRNESRRALGSFFLLIGRADDAVRITDQAMRQPDRRAHNSRDPAQDRAILALLDRAAHRMRAEQTLEASVTQPWYAQVGAWASASLDRWSGWWSGRVASQRLADDERLVGTFLVGTHRSAVMPPWLLPELVDVLGAGVVREAVARARRQDERAGSAAYYDAIDAEVALCAGALEEAAVRSARAVAALGPGEVLMRARIQAVEAEARRRQGERDAATRAYDRAFQADPGVFRRLGLRLPVQLSVQGGGAARRSASLIGSSPRLDPTSWGLTLRVEAERGRGRVCVLSPEGSVLRCAEASAEGGEDEAAFAERLTQAFHRKVFAPRVELSQADANSLDGSNRVSRDPLKTLFGHEPPPQDP